MEIKRKGLKHGDIVEIPLKNLAAFGYAKVIDPKKIKDPIDLPLFLRVYMTASPKELEDLASINRDLLLAPFYIIGQSAAITKFNWRILTNETVTEDEEWIPDTKQSWPPFVESPQKWGYFERFATNIVFSEYGRVKHLDDSDGKSIEAIPFIIQMELCKTQGDDIKARFGLEGWQEELYYQKFHDLPIYSLLPESMRGKALR